MLFSRREMLSLTALSLIAAKAPGAVAPLALSQGNSLDALAHGKGLRFGSALGNPGIADPAYARLILDQCGIITPESELKWQATRPTPTTFDFTAADAVVAFAETHGLAIRGHTLLWNRAERFPAWFADYDFGPDPRAGAERLLTTHIATVVDRYRTRIHSFDVINETIDPGIGTYRDNKFARALGGDALVDLAFHTARATDPTAQLVYNDYMGWEDKDDLHQTGVLRLLEGMRKRGTPCDALGVQSHLIVPPDETRIEARQRVNRWIRFIDEVVGMGYRILVTEFDVDDYRLPVDAGMRDRMVAAYGGEYLELMLRYPQLHTVVAWGLSDRNSWLQHFRPRSDGLRKRTCPYDDDLAPMPLRAAMADAFRDAPVRA